MKKHKRTCIACIIGLIFLIIGAGVFGAGLASGGSLRYLSVNKETLSWWPFQHGSIGFNSGYDEFEEFSSSKQYNNNLDNVTSVDIQAEAGEIEIYRGNTNEVSYYTNDKSNVKIDNQNGNLKITIEYDNLFMNHGDVSLKLTLRDELYDSINIENNLGDIDIQGVRAKSMTLAVDLGDIDLENIYSEAFHLEQKCGDIDVAGTLLGSIVINNKLGDTDVQIQGDINEYRYHVVNKLGETTIQDMEKDITANIDGGNASAQNVISIDNKLGDIELSIN